MKHTLLVGTAAACFCLGLAAPLFAAEPAATGTANHPAVGKQSAAAVKPAAQCLSDLRAFNRRMKKDGYWLGGSGYGYGYPMDEPGYAYGYPREGGRPISANLSTTAAGYQDVRPGYEVRMLVAAANILARRGQQQPCEAVLASTRKIYRHYVADMHGRGVPLANVPDWRQLQIAAAQPVTAPNSSFRSDELLDTEVRSPQDEALGSVDDLVMSPQTGKIAYLVVARGGIFGIDEKYVPVPWADFKVTPAGDLLVLDTTKAAMAAAPRVSHDQFTRPAHFAQEAQKVDAYWKTRLSNQGGDTTEGSGSTQPKGSDKDRH